MAVKILLDECLPRRLATLFPGHEATTVQKMGWSGLSNGELINIMDDQFDVFLTIDGSLTFQQNLIEMSFRLIILSAPTNQIEDLGPLVPEILMAIDSLGPGQAITLPS